MLIAWAAQSSVLIWIIRAVEIEKKGVKWLVARLLHPTVAVHRVIRLVDCVGKKRMAVRRPAAWATGWGRC